MVAVQKNIYVEQGATFVLAFRWMDADASGNPTTPKNLTGYTARMQVRTAQQAAPLGSADTTNGKIVLGKDPTNETAAADPTNGWVFIEFTPADTNNFTSKTAFYDVELQNAAGRVYRLLQGSVTVSPNITQDTTDPSVK